MFIKIGERIVALDAIAYIDPESTDASGRTATSVHLKGAPSFTVDDETAGRLLAFFRADAWFDRVRDVIDTNFPLTQGVAGISAVSEPAPDRA